MAIYIEIKRHLINNQIYYYLVQTEDFGGAHFYIGINPETKEVAFYKTDNFEEPIKILNLKNPHEIISVREISAPIPAFVIIKVSQALNKNKFPEHMDYAV